MLLRYTGQIVWIKREGPADEGWRIGIRFVCIENIATQPACPFRSFLQQGDPNYPINLRLKMERQ